MILYLAFAFPGLPIHVVAGGLVVAHADDGDVVQGGVALPVAAFVVFLFNCLLRFRGGDGMLDSLSGRSRHRGEVFEGAAQACGGVVRAVRA